MESTTTSAARTRHVDDDAPARCSQDKVNSEREREATWGRQRRCFLVFAFHALAHIDTGADLEGTQGEERVAMLTEQCPSYTQRDRRAQQHGNSSSRTRRQWQSTASRQPSSVSSHQSVGLVGTNIALSRNMASVSCLCTQSKQASSAVCVFVQRVVSVDPPL